ncbi:hypothetical protein [Salinimicrobium sediminilitoris]|uniref:hypothetical protein n=1 Tax=Salinimicrobium sediminilitoris TaxID=2876715 RepID=UPI001E450936|nr:hypothetical protein [Salinimicrobium sediminilitoris]MCC8361056.1 hypothetical protein [Salinimicrobium sediminilitoris]
MRTTRQAEKFYKRAFKKGILRKIFLAPGFDLCQMKLHLLPTNPKFIKGAKYHYFTRTDFLNLIRSGTTLEQREILHHDFLGSLLKNQEKWK